MIFQQCSKIIANRKISPGYFRLALEARRIAARAHPGQFAEVRISAGIEPLLRRPFSIHQVRGRNIEMLYAVVGPGTQALSQQKAGDYLDVIGPLGEGFKYPTPNAQYLTPILVAGGMGVAPLVFLAEKLTNHRPSAIGHRLVVLIGAKNKDEILCEKEFKNLGYQVKIATDNGSKGFKGKVTDLLKVLLSTIDYRLSTIYACGPRPMLKEASRISKKYDIPAQVSLEEHMACGIGACLGCVVKTTKGLKRVCRDGPVFNVEEIIW